MKDASSCLLRCGLAAGLALVLLACGGSSELVTDDEGAGSGAAGSGGAGTGGAVGSGGSVGTGGGSGEWETLIEGDWTMQPSTEGYVCAVTTVTEDIYIRAMRPIAPLGTHHTVLARGASGPDGVFACSVATNGPDMIYSSGVGTNTLEFPAGVAMKLEAGTKLMLNLHLFNASTDALSGLSAVQFQRMDPADVTDEANSVLAGTMNINIPPQSSKKETGFCTMPSDVTIFAVGPHMHQYGTHMTVSVQQGNTEEVVYDSAYSFDDQQHIPLTPQATLNAGDRVKVECSYNNPTNSSVSFGDSSLQEMCFASLFSYPVAAGLGLICTD